MNDLTKEELQDIAFALETVYMGNSDLRKKIQILINKYCEHEPSEVHYEQFRWQLCHKCGVQYK